jgi:hypothetical protein
LLSTTVNATNSTFALGNNLKFIDTKQIEWMI